MQPARFAIATGERGSTPRRWFWVRVHRTAAELQEAAYRLHPGTGRAFWRDCEGCCQAMVPDEAGGYPANGYAGIIRLTVATYTAEVVAHELLHAAVAVYRMNVCPDVRLGMSVGRREEDLAYIYGELFHDLDRRMPVR